MVTGSSLELVHLSEHRTGPHPGGIPAYGIPGSVRASLHCSAASGLAATWSTVHPKQCPVTALELSLTAVSLVEGWGRKHAPRLSAVDDRTAR